MCWDYSESNIFRHKRKTFIFRYPFFYRLWNTMAEDNTGPAASAEVTEECDFEETTASKLVEFEGSIGFKKGNSFISMTNFSLECVGYVKGDGISIDGFMFCVRPKSIDPRHQRTHDSGDNGYAFRSILFSDLWRTSIPVEVQPSIFSL